MKLYTFPKGGIHPPSSKNTGSGTVKVLPLPMKTEVLLSQHIGAPAEPVVNIGDHVTRGMLIAQSRGVVSANIHAPISGIVKAIGPVRDFAGNPVKAITIEASQDEHDSDTEKRETILAEGKGIRTLSETMSADEIRKIISSAGVVGLGGAAFPSVVKLDIKPETKVDFLIINGCECEPYLTCDDALMRAHPEKIVEGVELMLLASGARKAVIAVEDNKQEAIKALREALDAAWPVEVAVMKTKYPQGGEKQLIKALTGRSVGSGKLPISQGVIVNNVATSYAIYLAVVHHQPLIERIMTLDGNAECVEGLRGNYLVAIGTPLSAFGVKLPETGEIKVINGGPMMGRPVLDLNAPTVKASSGILFLSDDLRPRALACIRCGACVNVCPMGLEPYLISKLSKLGKWDEAESLDIADCIECGCCSYSCPSHRPLLDYIRVGKRTVAARARARKNSFK